MKTTSIAAALLLCCSSLNGAVTVEGNVNPTPDSDGGSINGTLTVGIGNTTRDTLVGVMRIDEATVLTVRDGIVGDRIGSIGNVTVQQSGSQWTATDDLFIGNDGFGELTISNRGLVSNSDDFSIGVDSDGRGRVTVTDSLSILDVGDQLTVGLGGIGTLTVTDGATVVSDGGNVGVNLRSNGQVEVTNSGVWRNESTLTLGAAGTGSLLISDGGFVENGTVVIGNSAGGHGRAVISGSQSLWLNRNDLSIGNDGTGELHVGDAATIQVNDQLSVGSSGRIELEGGRIIVTNDTSNSGIVSGVGRVDGAMTNAAGGVITARGDAALVLGGTVTNTGTISAINGQLEVVGELTNSAEGVVGGHDASFSFMSGVTNNGTMGFTSGDSDIFGDVTSTTNGSLTIGGEGSATFYGNVISAGALTVEPEAHAVFLGNLTVSASASIALAGLAADPDANGEPVDDPLLGTESIVLDGKLLLTPSVSDDDLTEPMQRGEFVNLGLISANSIDGSFDEVSYAGSLLSMDFLTGDGGFRSLDTSTGQLGLFRTLTYTDSEVSISNYLAIGGDANGDRIVDFTDFLILSDNFGQAGDWLAGNFNGDDVVDFADFLQLAQSFGTTVSAAAHAVPEPSTAAYAILLLVFATCRRSRFDVGLGQRR